MFTLCFLKNFIVQGCSWAFGEWFLKIADDNQRKKIVRWLVNSEEVIKYYDALRRKLEE